MSEIDKILEYLSAVKARTPSPSSDAAARSLFERWELRVKPLPFAIEGRDFELAGRKLKLPPFEGVALARYRWNIAENCASLFIESEDSGWDLPLRFTEAGELVPAEFAQVPFMKSSGDQGGRLEIVYDVINYLRELSANCELSKLSKKRFSECVDAVSSGHEPQTAKDLKKLPLAEIRALLKDASSDMPEDELGSQLSLGLDGSYANVLLDETGKTAGDLIRVPSRTPWTAMQELDYLAAACRFKLENERAFVLPFKGAKAVGPAEGLDLPLKLPVDPDAPLSQGEIIYVRRKGESGTAGTFKIDILDGDWAYGRLRCDFAKDAERCFDEMAGTLPRSPSEFIAAGLLRLRSSLESGEGLSPAQVFALGLKPFDFKPCDAKPEGGGAGMDAFQRYAWSVAVNPSNPVVLVQGPPGTGKSFVLEQVLRSLCAQGLRVLVAAPSNTAVDNICRRTDDLPVARFGNNPESVAPDLRSRCWIGEPAAIERFLLARRRFKGGGVFAGTCVGLLRDKGVQEDIDRNGLFDAILMDEAGMCAIPEFLLCAGLAKRVLLFGDHQQLPPFPLPRAVEARLRAEFPFAPRLLRASSGVSALERLAGAGGFPVALLQRSYRCQNPRLLRFASTLFYDAVVKPSGAAEYYRLPYRERELRYPRSTMRFYSTSSLPEEVRSEQLFFDGRKPGLANKAEAVVCASVFYAAIRKYPLDEISIIAPYKKQVSLLRETLSLEKANSLLGGSVSQERWDAFLLSRVATVDSFQGGESDVVIICYVRSNRNEGVGFIDNPNRINVAHTRCRREMHIVGDMACLKRQAKNGIFERLERAFRRDGEFVELSELPSSTLTA